MQQLRNSLLLVSILLAGCEQAKPAISDEDYALVLAANPGLTDECKRELRQKGMFGLNGNLCFEMRPPQRWKGIWNSGWEWNNFCPAPATTCAASFERNEMDLGFGGAASPKIAERGGTFEIEFLGRRSKYAGHYGHLNQYPQMMIVDRVIAIRRLKEPVD